MSESNSTSGGIGLPAAVFLVFLALKLSGVPPVSEWSWWWVTAPLWGVFLGVLAAIGLFAGARFVSRSVRGYIRRKRLLREMMDDDGE
jgi:hypothetical protein